MNGVLYVITNEINGKFYIGQTVKPLKTRLQNHIAKANQGSSSHLHNSMRKYGAAAFTIRPLIMNLSSKQELDEQEIFWIEKLEARDRKEAYNHTAGGDGSHGYKHSEEVLVKLRLKLKGRVSPRKGVKYSSELKAKLSTAHKTSQKCIDHWRVMVDRTASKRRQQTHCKHGHELTGKNVYWYEGRRKCVPCKVQRVRDYRAKKKASLGVR